MSRTCFYISPDSYVEGKGFIPSLVTEGEAGHTLLAGNGTLAEPWYWGMTYEEARRHAAEQNAGRGLTPEDVDEIITSSMRASGL